MNFSKIELPSNKKFGFFFSFVFDLLATGGIPSQKEIMVAENICEKVVGISNYMFEKFMYETDNMLNSFNLK